MLQAFECFVSQTNEANNAHEDNRHRYWDEIREEQYSVELRHAEIKNHIRNFNHGEYHEDQKANNAYVFECINQHFPPD